METEGFRDYSSEMEQQIERKLNQGKLSYKSRRRRKEGTAFSEEVHSTHSDGNVVDRTKPTHQVRGEVSLMGKNKETYSDGPIVLKKTA